MEINQKLSILEMKTRLSTLWIFTLLNVIFRDIHEFVRPGFLEELMTGVQVTDEFMLVSGIMLEIPIVMVILSRVLAYRVNRWANIIVAVCAIGLILINNTAPDLDNIFFAAVEIVSLVLIVWYAWKWPQP